MSCRITTTILAPTPLVAANFIILGKIIARLGPQYSRLSPKLCQLVLDFRRSQLVEHKYPTDTIVFCIFDLIALIVQAIGGAAASQAAETFRDPTPVASVTNPLEH
jgi:hypothetical protein